MSFSIRSLFGAMTAIGVALFLLIVSPAHVAVPLLVLLDSALAVLLLGGLVYGTANQRTFCLGAMVPAGATIIAFAVLLGSWLLVGAWETENWEELSKYLSRAVFTFRVWSGALWIMAPLLGLLMLATRRVLQTRRSDPREVPNPPLA